MSLSFSPKCKGSFPTIFIVDRFVTRGPGSGIQSQGGAQKGQPGLLRSFLQYPDPVVTAFSKALQDSLKLIVFKTEQTPPNAVPQSLFKITHVDAIEKVDPILGAGDVVVCFTAFPETYHSSSIDGTFIFGDTLGRDLDNVMSALRSRIFDKFMAAWSTVADLTKSPRPINAIEAKPEPDTLGIGGGAATPLNIALKRGGEKATYFASRTTLVEAGAVVGRAVDEWFGNTEYAKSRDAARRKVLKQLLSGAGDSEACTPAAVATLAGAKLEDSDQVLRTIGRGLGYTALHEIWHATRGPDSQPRHLQQTNSVIEGAVNPSWRREDLKLQSSSIAEIVKEYQATWCRFIGDGRNKVTELK
jgi:hypothetical protein